MVDDADAPGECYSAGLFQPTTRPRPGWSPRRPTSIPVTTTDIDDDYEI
jgi:hypothetical protein